jgi:hypothetical protein
MKAERRYKRRRPGFTIVNAADVADFSVSENVGRYRRELYTSGKRK